MLYHGSKHDIKSYLEPRQSYESEFRVYATDDIFYALIRCGNFDITKCLIREDYDDNLRSLAEVVPGAFKQVFDGPGYIYELDESDFTHNRYTEYISDKPVMYKNKIHIENVWKEILKHQGEYELVFYEDSDAYWEKVRGGRQGYLDRKSKIIEEILKRGK